MEDTPRKTPLHDWHRRHAGRMVDFAGWSMPIQYSSIVAEHHATRQAVGLFDISHMGRLRFDGDDVANFLDSVVTRRVANLKPGSIRYALITNESGGILDDVLVYCLADPDGDPRWRMVVNGANRDKIVAWLTKQLARFPGVTMSDTTFASAMLAIQGPRAIELASSVIQSDLSAMKYYTGIISSLGGQEAVISRTGYTGEDGCELIVDAANAEQLWQQLFEKGSALGATPIGLGARDTLRLEAAMPLYGHELSEDIDPFQAGLGFAVQLKDRSFIGHSALVAAKSNAQSPRRVGVVLDGRRPAREGYRVFAADVETGQVTSGTFSPTLERPIAMAYVRPEHAEPGTDLTIDIRGRRVAAKVVPLPFYTRTS